MAWKILRKCTDEDVRNLELAAQRFCARHELLVFCRNVQGGEDRGCYGDAVAEAIQDGLIPEFQWSVDQAIDGDARFRRLWRAIVRRTLDEPEATGCASGYVGYTTN